MTEHFLIRIADPFGERPVKVEVVEPGDPLVVESIERHCVVLKNEFDVLNLVAEVNKARVKAEKEAARQAYRASAVFREADAIINKLAWDACMSEGVGVYHERLREWVREDLEKYDKEGARTV